jgi:hypothetical protein
MTSISVFLIFLRSWLLPVVPAVQTPNVGQKMQTLILTALCIAGAGKALVCISMKAPAGRVVAWSPGGESCKVLP